MKGHEKIVEMLNVLLADELAAYNQYRAHAGMTLNCGYDGLSKEQTARAESEAEHAKELIARITLLGGVPVVSPVGKVDVAEKIPAQIDNDEAAEQRAVDNYNSAVRIALASGDNGTRALLEHILQEEEEHRRQLLADKEQITDMGLQNFLSTKV